MNFNIYKLALLILFSLFYSCNNNKEKENMTNIKFYHYTHNFQKIEINKYVEREFKFSNIGSADLIINQVRTSCKCSLVKWTKKHIKKGEEGVILIRYSASYPTTFHENILVYYNGKDSPETLVIFGEAIK